MFLRNLNQRVCKLTWFHRGLVNLAICRTGFRTSCNSGICFRNGRSGVIWFCHGRVMSRNKINELLTAKSSTFNHVLNTQQFRIGSGHQCFLFRSSRTKLFRCCSKDLFSMCNDIVFPHISNDNCSTIPLST